MAKRTGMTDLTIVNLKPKATRYEVRDHGARGLRVVVQPSGVKSFAVRYELKGGKSVKLTLGRWVPPADRNKGAEPKIGGALSLGQARVLAAAAMNKVTEGLDPAGEKREVKEERKEAAANTFEAVALEYLKRECGMKLTADGASFDRSRKRSGADRYRSLQRAVFPTLGTKPIAEIRKSDVVRLMDQIVDERGLIAADRCLALIRKIMNWWTIRSDNFVPPIVRGMARVKPSERARDRVLDAAELRQIWWQADGEFGDIVKLLILTGARRTEIGDLCWSEINLEERLITLPPRRTKNKRPFEIPMTPIVVRLLKAQPRVEGRDYIFGSGEGGYSGWSKSKAALDDAVAFPEKWTLHDFRRSFSTTLHDRLGVDPHIVEALLNHVSGHKAGVGGVYNKASYREQKRTALEAWAALIETIVNPPPGNVLPFQKAAE